MTTQFLPLLKPQFFDNDGIVLAGGKVEYGSVVARTVEAKLNEYISVKDFGAVGDGVTNDAAAIQAAIDYVAGLGGGTVVGPVGVYNIGTTSIVMKNRVRLAFEGMPYLGTSSTSATAPSVIKYTGSDAAIKFGDGSTFGTQGAAIENVEVFGASTGVNGIVFHGTTGSNAGSNLVRNVHVSNFTGNGITGQEHSFVNDFENVSTSKCAIGFYLMQECNAWTLSAPISKANGINFKIGQGSGTSQDAIRIIDATSEDATSEGILIDAPTKAISISNLYSEGCAKESIKVATTSATLEVTGGVSWSHLLTSLKPSN